MSIRRQVKIIKLTQDQARGIAQDLAWAVECLEGTADKRSIRDLTDNIALLQKKYNKWVSYKE